MVTKERTLLQDSIFLGLGFREWGIQQQTLKRDFSLEMTTSTFPLSHFSSCSRTGLSSQPLWSSLSTSNTPQSSFILDSCLNFSFHLKPFPTSLHMAGSFSFFILRLNITSSRKPSLTTLYEAVPPFIPPFISQWHLSYFAIFSCISFACVFVYLKLQLL